MFSPLVIVSAVALRLDAEGDDSSPSILNTESGANQSLTIIITLFNVLIFVSVAAIIMYKTYRSYRPRARKSKDTPRSTQHPASSHRYLQRSHYHGTLGPNFQRTRSMSSMGTSSMWSSTNTLPSEHSSDVIP